MTAVVGFLGAIIGALLGGIATYFTTRSTMRLTLEHSYDQTLQRMRLKRYQALFHTTKCLPRYWPPSVEEPKRKDLERYLEEFHDWYFSDDAGGMFLSPAAMDIYMRLLNCIAEAAFRNHDAGGASDSLHPAESEALRGLATDLRHQLIEDIGASNPPRLRWTRPAPLPPPPELGN